MKPDNMVLYFLKSLLGRPLEKIVYCMSGFFPRKKELWLFGARKNGFSCNPKYLFMHVALDEGAGVRCVWVSRNAQTVRHVKELGFDAVQANSLLGVWLCLRAAVYFVNAGPNDISFKLSRGAVTVNLWHGIPLKKISFDNDRRRRCQEKNKKTALTREKIDQFLNPKKSFRYDFVLSTSEFVTDYSFKSAFDVPASRCLSFGYPRTDIFFLQNHSVEYFTQRYEPNLWKLRCWMKSYQKVILYAPTWRDTGEDFLTLSGIDFASLDQQLERKDACLLLKLHPFTKLDADAVKGLRHVRIVDHQVDIYPLMYFSDVLITDYSSIYFDFLLLDKKIVFFCFDKADYLSDCRNLYFDYDEYTPGVKVSDSETLWQAVFSEDTTEWKQHRAAVKQRFWGDYDGNAGARLVNFVKRQLAE